MTSDMISVSGQVVRGHRVASGMGGDPRFPAGTIAPQLPFFKASIADFDDWLGGPAWPGTINVALPDTVLQPGVPDIAVGPVAWTDHFPPERFLLSRCGLIHRQIEHPAWLYIPDPATKPDHYQPGNLVELLTQRLAALAYGDPVSLRLPSRAVILSPATTASPRNQSH